jgi:hypothetical protein
MISTLVPYRPCRAASAAARPSADLTCGERIKRGCEKSLDSFAKNRAEPLHPRSNVRLANSA